MAAHGEGERASVTLLLLPQSGEIARLDPSSAVESFYPADLVRNFIETKKEGFASTYVTNPSLPLMKQTLPYILFWAGPILRGRLSQITIF